MTTQTEAQGAVRRHPELMVVTGAAFMSGSAVFVTLAETDAATTAFLRCAIAVLVLAPLAAYEVRRHGRLGRKETLMAVGAGAFLGLDFLMWTVSVLDIGASIATVLISTQLIAFPLLARVLDGIRVPRRFLLAAPVMLIGVALASGALGYDDGVRNPVRGAVLGIVAGCAYSGYLYLMRRAGTRSPSHLITPVCVATAAAAAVAGALGPFTSGLSMPHTAESWGWILMLAVFSQAIAWLFVNAGSAHIAPNTSSALLLSQPVLGVGLGMLVLAERPSGWQLLGCVLVFAGMWASQRRMRAGLSRARKNDPGTRVRPDR